MNLFMRLVFIVLSNVIIFSACQQKVATPTKAISNKTTTQDTPIKVKKNSAVTQAYDTINRTNTVEFLTAYGKENPETDILIETRLGDIKIRLYRDTPIHRASFVFLTKVGYFSTTCVHRIVQDFVVQAGNSEQPKTRRFRSKYQSYTIPAEFRENRKHKYGALAAARDWDNNPNKRSTPFEFYFVQDKNGSYHLDGEHTVFGEIISGFDTLEKIALVEVGNDEWPVVDVFFKVSVLK